MKTSRPVTNKRFSTPVYLKACELAGIRPTRRQASKWRNGKGLARTFMNAAIIKLGEEKRQ